jgi:hypothetical protein
VAIIPRVSAYTIVVGLYFWPLLLAGTEGLAMRLRNPDLTHLLEKNAAFTDVSRQANNYLQDSFEVELGPDETYYVGYYKPFKNLYLEMLRFDTNSALLIFEIWNGSTWVAIDNLIDHTDHLKENNFIQWQFLDDGDIQEVWKKTTVNSKELFYVRITSSSKLIGESIGTVISGGNTTTRIHLADTDLANFAVGDEIILEEGLDTVTVTAVTGTHIDFDPAVAVIPSVGSEVYNKVAITGNNIVFCNLDDLKIEFPRILDFLDPSLTSFINFQVAARDEIVQRLRSGGEYVYAELGQTQSSLFLNGSSIRQINKWDFLDIEEIRQAAKFLTLAKIFFYVSENNEDKAFTRYQNNMDMFGAAFKNFYLSLDTDDDGDTDDFENMDLNDCRIEIV